MSRLNRFFNISLKRPPEPVWEYENVVRSRTVYEITPLSQEEGHLLQINAPKDFHLLSGEEYITVRQASNETRLSIRKIQDLCRYRVVKSRKTKRGMWLLERNSLLDYLEEIGNDF